MRRRKLFKVRNQYLDLKKQHIYWVIEIQWAESEASRLYPSQVDRSQNFFQGGSSAREYIQGELSQYHRDAHQKATSYLKALFFAVQRHPHSVPLAAGCAQEVAMPAMVINGINREIESENLKNSKDKDLGIIRYQRMMGAWKMVITDPSMATSQAEILKSFCAQFDYPKDWATFNVVTSVKSPRPPQASHNQSLHGQASHMPGQTMNPNALQLQHRYAGGRIRTIPLVPRKIARSVNPGYTSSGEKIRMIQNLGMTGARFVIEDANGKIRLVSSAAAGGQLAIDGARSTGVPVTMQREQDISSLRNVVRSTAGGTYGINWVAIGQVDASHNKSPFMVVGFYFESPDGAPPQEAGISRSALKRILSPKEADRLISEAITEDPDMALKDAISSLSGLDLRPGTGFTQPSSFPYLSGGNPNAWNPMINPTLNSGPLDWMERPVSNGLSGQRPFSNPWLIDTQQQSLLPNLVQQSSQPDMRAFIQYTGAHHPTTFGLPAAHQPQQPLMQHLATQPEPRLQAYSEEVDEVL